MTNLQICASSVGDKLAWQNGNQPLALWGAREQTGLKTHVPIVIFLPTITVMDT